MKYQKGESGNPDGRPKGIPDKRSALRTLLEPHAQALVKKVVELAKQGDTTALRMCIDRLIPPVKAKDMPVEIGSLDGALADQGRTVFAALSAGTITPDEANALMQAVAAQARIIEVDELEKRVAALESLKSER
jgi:uncharacterized protein DUF5681